MAEHVALKKTLGELRPGLGSARQAGQIVDFVRQSWAYPARVSRTALVSVCGSWVRKCFVFRRSSLNHRSWISEPVLSSWSNCSGCFEKSILLAPQSGRRPSVSVNRYSRPSSRELKSCPERSKIAGSPANATTERDPRTTATLIPGSSGLSSRLRAKSPL